TAFMERDLDEIEAGKKAFLQVTRDFYAPFKKDLEQVSERQHEIKTSLQEGTKETCPKCGSELIIRWGRNGKFMACSSYPECKHTQPLEEPEDVDEKCEKCGKPMVIKHGRFGRFLACSGYPDCKNTQAISIGVACPKEGCTGSLVEKRSRRGRIFFGCSKYPNCKFASWNRPVNVQCSACQSPYLEMRSNQTKGDFLYCPACKSEFQAEEKETDRAIAFD
ncbi:MAG: topoisomerase DNA-binding C4 zinc finger domain-containing protein, partial [bacterium]